jgi:hypothetical protein
MPDLRLSRRAVALAPVAVRVARPAQRPAQGNTPGGGERGWEAFTLGAYPLDPGDLADFAARQPGVTRAGGEGDEVPRLSIGGQDPSRTGLTLDGASFGAASIPSEALRSVAVVQSTYDPARGQFSSGQVAATTRSGTNQFGGALRLRGSHPLLQAPGGGGAGSEPYTLAYFSGGAGGALVRDRTFWYGAVQGSERSAPHTDLSAASRGQLAGFGADPDSAARLRVLAARAGLVPPAHLGERVSRRGSALLRTDAHLTPDHTLTFRLDGRASHLSGAAGSPLAIGGGGEADAAGGGVLAQLASYFGDVRNEFRLYAARETRESPSASSLPGAYVTVAAARGDGAVTQSQFRVGGTGRAGTHGWGSSLELADEILVGIRERPHRFKLGALWSTDQAHDESDGEAPGTFLFRSLADFEAARPSLFTRTLGGRQRSARSMYGAAFAAHFWRARPGLWLIDGVRVERAAVGDPPSPASVVPAPAWSISPRIGFTAEARDRRWEIRGGTGMFVARHSLVGLQEALSEADTVGAAHELTCVGPAAPSPLWTRYAADPDAIPSACADGAPLFATRLAGLTTFAPDFAPPRNWRASLGGNLDAVQSRAWMVSLHGEAEISLGLAQPLATDVNLVAMPAFTLAEEGDRPVYVEPKAVDLRSGTATLAHSRTQEGLGVVRRLGSSGRSRAVQVSVGGTMLSRRLDLISFYYTHTRSNDEVAGLPAPGASGSPYAAGDPRSATRGPSDFERRHVLQMQGIYPINRWLRLGAIGRVSSGVPYTPMVDADVNGDGIPNDPAYVFDPNRTRDDSLGAAMGRLLQRGGAAAGCLRRSLGGIAERNGCTTPWSWSLDLQANVDGAKLASAPRLHVALVAYNVVAGLDQLLHGSTGLRGWGDPGFPDPVLLRVSGFDPAGRAYRYSVNPAFGTGAGARNPYRTPFTVAIQARLTVGKDPVRQPVTTMINAVRGRGRSVTEIREQLNRIPNLFHQVLSAADSLRLELTDVQRSALRDAGDTSAAKFTPLADTLASAASRLETAANPAERRLASAALRQSTAAMQAYVDGSVRAVREMLTPAQWAMLPETVRNPSRQLINPNSLPAGGTELW